MKLKHLKHRRLPRVLALDTPFAVSYFILPRKLWDLLATRLYRGPAAIYNTQVRSVQA